MENLKMEINQQADQFLKAANLDPFGISNLSDFTKFVTRFFKGGQWVFRGEGRLHEFPATPSIFRGIELSNERFPDKHITDQEILEVENCQKDYNSGAITDRYIRAFLPSINKHDVNWLPLARHFEYLTRLLDVTCNPLVGLFFSCQNSSPEENGFVYAMSSGSFRPVNDRQLQQKNRSDYPPIPNNYLDLYDVDVLFWGEEIDDLPYLFEPTIPQERMQAQSGRFLFWRKACPVIHSKCQVIPIRISGNSKVELLNELSAFGIRESVLFPGKKHKE